MGEPQVNARVRKRRAALHKAGLRPVQIWVPDSRRPEFAKECRRQTQRAARADVADLELHGLMDALLDDADA